MRGILELLNLHNYTLFSEKQRYQMFKFSLNSKDIIFKNNHPYRPTVFLFFQQYSSLDEQTNEDVELLLIFHVLCSDGRNGSRESKGSPRVWVIGGRRNIRYITVGKYWILTGFWHFLPAQLINLPH